MLEATNRSPVCCTGGTTTRLRWPYGFPVDLQFDTGKLNFTILAARHAPGVSPETILQELLRVGAITEVGTNVWKPLKQEYIEPSLSPVNLGRMASLVESLLATLENNTSSTRSGTDLFERTVNVDTPLTAKQLLALQSYMKTVGAQFCKESTRFRQSICTNRWARSQAKSPIFEPAFNAICLSSLRPTRRHCETRLNFN